MQTEAWCHWIHEAFTLFVLSLCASFVTQHVCLKAPLFCFHARITLLSSIHQNDSRFSGLKVISLGPQLRFYCDAFLPSLIRFNKVCSVSRNDLQIKVF